MEKRYHYILSFWILVPLLVEVIQVYLMGAGSSYTVLLNVVGFLFSLFLIRKDICLSDLKSVAVIYAFYLFNFFVFPENRKYFMETSVYILLFIYMPIGALVVRKITDWIGFWSIFKWFSIVAVLCGVYITMFSQVSILADYFSYMDFSYFFIPFIAGCYVPFRMKCRYRYLFLALVILGLFEILIYGARGAVFFALIFIVLYEFFREDGGAYKTVHLVLLLFAIIVLWRSMPIIIEKCSDIEMLSDSRFLSKYMNSELFESDGRDIVYQNAKRRLDTMGLDIAGLFGDRQYNNGFWPHNYFYELWMQMGWVFGTILIISTLILFYKSMFKSSAPTAALFFIVIFGGRYILSGSYAIEGRFWLMIYALFAISKPIKIKY